MRGFIRSDLFRSFMGGFLMGAVALVAFSPAESTDSLKSNIESIYRA